jgi:atypical dual specificity phosphatase
MNIRSKNIIFISVLFFQVVYCTKLVSVSIQESIPEILTKNNFSWIVPGVIAGIAMPQNKEQIRALHELNIGLVVTLTESEKEGPDPEIFNGIDIERLLLPVPDFHTPTVAQVDKFIKKSKEVIEKTGKAIVVHCMGGKGRTGTMLACWLIANRGMKPDDAIILIKQKRPKSIETADQMKFVGKYYTTLLSRRLKALEAVNEKLKEWQGKGAEALSKKAIDEKLKQLEEQAEGSYHLTEFYEGVEAQIEAEALRGKLVQLKEKIWGLKEKLTLLQQRLLLLKAKLEKKSKPQGLGSWLHDKIWGKK